MLYKYHTKSGSVYVHTVDAYGDTWEKMDRDGKYASLAGAVHLTRRRLQSLITDYPIAALTRTTIFGKTVAREFFDDVIREDTAEAPAPETEDSTIFFLIEREDGRYSLGHSSRVQRVEIIETIEREEKSKIRY